MPPAHRRLLRLQNVQRHPQPPSRSCVVSQAWSKICSRQFDLESLAKLRLVLREILRGIHVEVEGGAQEMTWRRLRRDEQTLSLAARERFRL